MRPQPDTIAAMTAATNSSDVVPWHGRRLSIRSGHDFHAHRPSFVGIIGGIGPLADVRLAQLIVDLDNKRCLNSTATYDSGEDLSKPPNSGFIADECHTPYLLYSNPRYIPNNNLANLGLGPSSVDALINSAKLLTSAGANVIGIACTAAHTWRDEVEQRMNSMVANDGGGRIKVLDLLEMTAAAVAEDGHSTVGLVEVDGTIESGLFEEAMRRHGIEPIFPDTDNQIKIMEIVSKIKQGQEGINLLRRSMDQVVENLALKNKNITAVVFGCTDIAAIMGGYHVESIQIYDTLQVLAEEIIRISNQT